MDKPVLRHSRIDDRMCELFLELVALVEFYEKTGAKSGTKLHLGQARRLSVIWAGSLIRELHEQGRA